MSVLFIFYVLGLICGAIASAYTCKISVLTERYKIFLIELFIMICLMFHVHTKSINNIRLLKIDKPQLNTEMLKVKVIHTQ